MKPRFASQQEISDWDNLVLANPDDGNVFGSMEFAIQKKLGGYNSKFIILGDLAITVLEKRVPLLGRLWYLPKGPGVESTKDLFSTIDLLKPFAAANGAFAIKIEPELPRDQSPAIAKYGGLKVVPIIPNPSTITLDISGKLDDVMTNLPQKGRHAIKRAERDGVTVKLVKSSEENCKIMYQLWAATANGRFGIRNYEYYRTFWQRFESAGYGQMFFAYYDGKIVAGAYDMVFGTKSTYKDGASVKDRKVYGASHLLQWEIIKWAKSRGALIHDFCGSPPSEEINNPNHKHYGVGLFKTSFNKTVTDYVGCYDIPLNNLKYKIWATIAERIARRVYLYTKHDTYY